MTNRGRPYRNRLLKADPHCYYCGREVVPSKERDKNSRPDVATVEHIPPLWIARLSKTRIKVQKVLACRRCNARKNKEDQSLFPSYFIILWTTGKPPNQKRKMLAYIPDFAAGEKSESDLR